MRTTFSTPVTPTRESPTAIWGGRAWTSSPAPAGAAASDVRGPACTASSVARCDRPPVRSRASPTCDSGITSACARWFVQEEGRTAGAQPHSNTAGVKRNAQGCLANSGEAGARERFGRAPGRSLGVHVTEKLEGVVSAAEPAVVELEELQGVIAEGQDRGVVTTETLTAALDEAELSPAQTQDLLSYLEEHGI